MNIRKDYDMRVIGKNLRKLRIQNGYSIEEIREYLCLGSVQAVYKYELGTSYPPGDTLLALMEIYHADVYDIINTDEEDAKSSSCFYSIPLIAFRSSSSISLWLFLPS